MKRHLRPSIKWFIIGLVSSQVMYHSLNAYNTRLEAHYHSIELSIEDNAISEHITLTSNEIEPCSTSSSKSYMDYRTITSKTSEQYQFIQEHMSIKDGYLLDDEGYIGVALGSWFGDIGERWVFTLEDGKEIYVVKVEQKDDAHTVDGCEHKVDGSVIEFVIDSNYFTVGKSGYVYDGNFNNNEWFNGTIKSVRKGN